jgi:hypothetical protein
MNLSYNAHMGIVLFVALMAISSNVSAAGDNCKQLFHPVRIDLNRSGDLLFLDPSACVAKRINTPTFSCSITVGYQHGAAFLRCENSFSGTWITRPTSDERSYFDTVGFGKTATVPNNKILKRAYDESRDTDSAQPVDSNDRPKDFVDVGPRIHIDNPDFDSFVQIIMYKSFRDKIEIAVTSEAALGCKKIQFATWATQETLWTRIKDMASFVADLRAQNVQSPRAAFDEAKIPPSEVNASACAPEGAN